jgi:hypothetical protein
VRHPTEVIPVVMLYVVIPIALARWLNHASWLDTGKAFALLWGLLLLIGLATGTTNGERFGWPLILRMFVSIPGIPLLLWIMR